jgi:hypothetical protein
MGSATFGAEKQFPRAEVTIALRFHGARAAIAAGLVLFSGCRHPRPREAAPFAAPRLPEASLVANRFAPVFLQARSDRSGDGKEFEDHFVRYDFDGNASGYNNWESLSAAGVDLRAFVYSAVRETDQNYYLHYAYFHPRDPKLIGKHENDFEGAMVVVRKGREGGPDARDISLVQVQAHNRWEYARLDGVCRLSAGEAVDAAVCTPSGSDARTHVVLTSQVGHNFWFNQGHGTEIRKKGDFPRKRITYVPWTSTGAVPMSQGEAGTPEESGEPVTYVLVSLSGDLDGDGVLDGAGAFGDPPRAGLWDRRRDVRLFGKEGERGRALQGDDGCKANAPWGWTGFGDERAGVFFLEPTRDPAWSELKRHGVVEEKDAAIHPDPYGNDSNLHLFPPAPLPLTCECDAMHAAFLDSNASPAPDGLPEGGPCARMEVLRAVEEVSVGRSEWDTCEELREWVPEGAESKVADHGSEEPASCSLSLSGDVILRWPREGAAQALGGMASPLGSAGGGRITHVSVRARSRGGALSLGGFFLQAGVEYDESLGNVPLLRPRQAGETWTTLKFALNASPYFRPGVPPALIVLSPDPSHALQPTENGVVPSGPPWEVDRIELRSESDPREALPAAPVVQSVAPASVAYGDRVTLLGLGFATPCAFNDVRLGDQPQLVVECSPTRLVFEARGRGSLPVSVRTSGGGAAVVEAARLLTVGPAR